MDYRKSHNIGGEGCVFPPLAVGASSRNLCPNIMRFTLGFVNMLEFT